MNSVSVKHITFRRGAMDCKIACPLEKLYINEQTCIKIKEIFPNIGKQVCVNGKGEFFEDEICGTEAPHLLEHIMIELLGSVYNKPFTGHTSWAEELSKTAPDGFALMRVTVTYLDDIVALAALKHALVLLEWALAEEFEDVMCVQTILDDLHDMITA